MDFFWSVNKISRDSFNYECVILCYFPEQV